MKARTKTILILSALAFLVSAVALGVAATAHSSLRANLSAEEKTFVSALDLANQILRLTGPPQIEAESKGFDELLRLSFPDDLAQSRGVPAPAKVEPARDQYLGFDRAKLTIHFENLSLQQLVAFLFEAEQVPGVRVWEISTLTPMPAKSAKWKAVVTLVALGKKIAAAGEDQQ